MKKISYIDPIIGTVADREENGFIYGGGKTYPGACAPGGMVQLSPDTISGGDTGSGYSYYNETIEGFSFNHMSGIGWYGDLGNLQVMPIVGKTDLRSGTNEEMPFKKGTLGWRSEYSHDKEKASVGYYSVELERYGIIAELSALTHCGIMRITYPESSEAGLLFNFSRRIAGHADFQHIDILDDRTLSGTICCTHKNGGFGRGDGNIDYTLHFYCQLSKAPKTAVFFSDEEHIEGSLKSCEGEDVGLELRFDTAADEPVLLRCGISYVDIEGARKNLEAECPDFDFERVKEGNEAFWEKAFECVEVESENQVDKTLFYSCLYHTMLDPRTTVDVDGRCVNAKGELISCNYHRRTMFSGWDVYRSAFPLLTLLRPDVVSDTINSLTDIAYENNTTFPRWELMGIDSTCMVGDPALLVIADAYVKGIRDFDVQKAYSLARASSNSVKEYNGRPFKSLYPDCKAYKENAFVPNELSGTVEFLLADYAHARFAEALGDSEAAEYYYKRAATYKDNFNSATGFMGPRNENGEFLPVKDEYDTVGCVESNIYQQSWFVPYDVEGICSLFDKERAIELLERLFERADLTAFWNVDYNHSNEPCHNLTHYFNILGLPRRTQYWTRHVQKESYHLNAFGFCGNEDVGQLSAWYVLSAIGFAQVCPTDKRFYINTPLFKKAQIKLDPKYHTCSVSNKLIIECDDDPLLKPYIKSIELNGTQIDRLYVTYEELTNGGVLLFKLSD